MPIQVDAESSRPLAARRRSKTSRSTVGGKNKRWLAIGGAAVAVLLVVVVVWMSLGGGNSTRSNSASRQAGMSAGKGVIEIALSDEAAKEASILIGKQEQTIPESGQLRCTVAAGTHQIVLRRRGFEQIEVALMVKQGEVIEYRPEWKPVSLPGFAGSGAPAAGTGESSSEGPKFQLTFDDWLQEFDKACEQARQTNKDILVLFDGSDWCGYSMRMADEVFFDRRFGDLIAPQYVLVFIDFPRSDGGKAKVQDLERNARCAERFSVSGFPTIVTADEDGRPFGRMGYIEGGFDAFAQQLGLLQRVRDQRNSLLAQVDVNSGAAKLEAVQRLFELVSELDFEAFYEDKFRQWYEASKQFDPRNERGQQESYFETWWRTYLAAYGPQEDTDLAARVRELDSWQQQHSFADRERAARMHLQAAWFSREQPELAKKYATAGLRFEPRDEQVRELLEFLKASVENFNVVAAGSGFVVAKGGYLLTNQHVAAGPGRLVVRWPGLEKPVAATLVATADNLDLALLRAEATGDAELAPLRLSDDSPARGARVTAFGYPLGERMGKGVILTTGVVSATDEQTENHMILLDCLINPGNSGGPLCNNRGEVVGIVTARSLASAEVDSYGMAIPGRSALEFLEESLPGYDAQQIPLGEQVAGDLEAIDRRVSPSVLMIQRLRE